MTFDDMSLAMFRWRMRQSSELCLFYSFPTSYKGSHIDHVTLTCSNQEQDIDRFNIHRECEYKKEIVPADEYECKQFL